jgi:hypothetical protein
VHKVQKVAGALVFFNLRLFLCRQSPGPSCLGKRGHPSSISGTKINGKRAASGFGLSHVPSSYSDGDKLVRQAPTLQHDIQGYFAANGRHTSVSKSAGAAVCGEFR